MSARRRDALKKKAKPAPQELQERAKPAGRVPLITGEEGIEFRD